MAYILLVVILIASVPIPAFSFGIPVFQYYDNQVYSAANAVVSNTSYGWYQEDGLPSNPTYYKVILLSPSYLNTDYYITALNDVRFSMLQAGYSGSWGGAYIDGTLDGVNWYTVYSKGLGGANIVDMPIQASKQLRVVIYAGSMTSYCSTQCYVSFYKTTISSLGADQATVQTAANASINAANYAQAAQSAANSANTAAQQAKTSADNAAARSWYSGTYGGSQQSVSDLAGYIAYSQIPALNSKIDNMYTTINNLSNADNSPPVPTLKTVSGAMATSGRYIQVVLTITDNVSSSFIYSLNNRDYEPVPDDKLITLPVPNPGSNVISVWVKDEAGNIGSSSIVIRKI
jgi:hypothetical protein